MTLVKLRGANDAGDDDDDDDDEDEDDDAGEDGSANLSKLDIGKKRCHYKICFSVTFSSLY